MDQYRAIWDGSRVQDRGCVTGLLAAAHWDPYESKARRQHVHF